LLPRASYIAIAIGLALACSQARGQGPRLISEADYVERLKGMWLGEVIANWTGLRTEGVRNEAPFLTDADWGQPLFGSPLDFVTSQDPWGADDNTDIEYVYLHLLANSSETELTGREIADGWIAHINRDIWVSNAAARALFDRNVIPPRTSLGSVNELRLFIDAQLTTEFFGAFCPGQVGRTLDMADMPIRTTASSYAAHASQFYAALHALAPLVDPSLSGRDQVLWLYREARRYIPDTSKSADVADFVLQDFLTNPDVNNWELTRDRVYERYHHNAAANGFVYRGFVESSVNFACGCIALLYGQGDYRRTVQIGTLGGWDSDDQTATMGGVLGLMLGDAGVRAAFPDVALSERYDILSTRDNLPDYVAPPGDNVQDTFTLMAQRMIPIARREVLASGGLVDAQGGRWLLGPVPRGAALAMNPLWREDQRSANNLVRRAGGVVTGTSTAIGAPYHGWGSPIVIADGMETSFSGAEEPGGSLPYYSSEGATGAPPSVTLTVTYDRPVTVHTIRFIEGDHFTNQTSNGGWFTDCTFQALVDGVWTSVPGTLSEPLDAATPFQVLDFVLATPVQATGIRISGTQGGTNHFVTCGELDALSAPIPAPTGTFDLDGDGSIGVDDLYWWEAAPVDLDGDAEVGDADRRYLTAAVRFVETRSMCAGRP
jgi:hypothetical protein